MDIASILTDSRKLTYILGGAIGLMVFVALIFILRSSVGSGAGTGAATIQVWGVFDDQTAFDAAIQSFEKANKNISVEFKMIPTTQNYEQTLINALAAGTGPDVFMIHNSWLPKHIGKLAPLPAVAPGAKAPLMSIRQFQDTFVDVAYNDLVSSGKIYGMPLYVDTLALYYNKDLFSTAGIAQPPVTWNDFLDDVKKLTTYDASRNVIRSGAAIGSAHNVNRATDILMMLMLQSGVQMTNPDNTEATFAHSVDGQPVGENALTFYTDFTNPQKEVYTWNESQDYSIDAFSAGKTAMMINYAHQMPIIQQKASRLNWAVAPAPQASVNDKRTYADYWPLSVSGQSKYPNQAWQFVYYMTAGDGALAYLNATNRPTARRDLVSQQQSDPNLGVFAEQSLTARSWHQADDAAIETIFSDMIDNVNLGRQSVTDAIKGAEDKTSVLMAGH